MDYRIDASPSDAQTRTTPQPSRGVTIHEPPAQVETHVASSSQPVSACQPNFELDGMPLLADASVRVWEKGEGGRIVQSLAHGLLLPEDVSAFADGTKESIGRLQWHTIAITSLSLYFLFSYTLIIAIYTFLLSCMLLSFN